MRFSVLVLSLVVPVAAQAAKQEHARPSAAAVADVRGQIGQARVPAAVKARASGTLDKLLELKPSRRVNEGTLATSAEGSPFIHVEGKRRGRTVTGGVGFRGIAQRRGGVSWSEGSVSPGGAITTSHHEVAPASTPGIFVEKVFVSHGQRNGITERFLGGEIKYFQLDAGGKRVGELSEPAAKAALRGP